MMLEPWIDKLDDKTYASILMTILFIGLLVLNARITMLSKRLDEQFKFTTTTSERVTNHSDFLLTLSAAVLACLSAVAPEQKGRVEKLIKRIHAASLPPTDQPFDPKDN